MRRFLAFVLGLVGTYLAVAVIMLLLVNFRVFVDRDGGVTMGIIFVIAPIASVIGGVIAAIVFGRSKSV